MRGRTADGVGRRARSPARLIAVAGLMALAWLALDAASARAQAETEVAEARGLFARATAELRAGHFTDARDLLVEAQALAPNPGIAFNLAVAYRGTGELLHAEAVLAALLEEDHGALAAAQRTEVEAFVAEVRSEIGVLRIDVAGLATAEVRLDGRLVAAGDLRVDPGEHTVLVSAIDHVTAERHVLVERGEHVELRMELSREPESLVGTIVLEASDASHHLEIVDVARGIGRLEQAVAPGEYVVRVTSGSASREARVSVRARSQTRYVFDDPNGRSVVEEPAFWIVGALVVLGGAVGLGVGLTLQPSRAAPVSDPVFGIVMALGPAG